MSIGFERNEVKLIEEYLLSKLDEFKSDIEILANLQFSLADLYLNDLQLKKAEDFFKSAKSNFLAIDENHEAISVIESAIEKIELENGK